MPRSWVWFPIYELLNLAGRKVLFFNDILRCLPCSTILKEVSQWKKIKKRKNKEKNGLWIGAIYYCKYTYDLPPSPFLWEPATFYCRGGCILLMGEKRSFFVVLLLWNVSTPSGILDEKGKMFFRHLWFMIKMNDAFNENHLMNTYPARPKAAIEAQETEKWTTPPSSSHLYYSHFPELLVLL